MSPFTWEALRWTGLGLMLLVAAACDLRDRRIPNRVVLPGALVGLALSASHAGLALSVLGGLVALSIFLALHGLGWMGAGDVKLAAAAGLYFSPSQAFHACLLMLLAGGLVAMTWLVLARSGPRTRIPYGVAIALGAGYQAWHVSAF
jgi:prepilin peptidase CpaA